MFINLSYKFHRIPDRQSRFIIKVHDLLGQPSYVRYLLILNFPHSIVGFNMIKTRGSSAVRHLPLMLEVPGSISARGEENFGVRTRFL